MNMQQPNLALRLSAIALCVAGCAGGDDPRTRSDVVIEPRQEEAAPAADEQPADEQPAAPAAPESITADSSPAPAAEAKPEMQAEQPAATEVAAAPAKEAAPAETAEDKPAAEDKPTETTAAKPAAEEPAADKGTTFKGRVVVKGDIPTIAAIKPSGNDAYCIDLGEIPNDEVIVGEDNGLANVFVWVRKVPSGVEVPAPPSEPAVLDQKGCRFTPPAVVVQVGQDFLVKNDDATLHNTRLTGFANSFNMTVAPNNRDGESVDLKRPERFIVPVKCDIHSWMSGRILITDNPWNAITDKDGNFEINNLPAGELEFMIQHGQAGYVEKSLTLTFEDGEVKEQTFEVDASKLAG